MNNAEKFKSVFGIYATELWALPEKDFLEWLNEEYVEQLPPVQPQAKDVPDTNVGDTIYRQDAIDGIDNSPLIDWYYGDICPYSVKEMLRELPPAQPQRMHGKWIHDGYDIPHGVDWMHCSRCGRREPHVPAAMTNFCPHCGADMREECDNE